MDMLRLGALAVTAALCALIVRQKSQEIGLVLALCASVMLLCAVIPAFSEIRALVDELAEAAEVSEAVIAPVMKTVGLAIVTKLAAEVCRDAKESGIASFVELAGAAAAILVAVPLLRMVLQLIGGFL